MNAPIKKGMGLSASEKELISQAIALDCRIDGRSRNERRNPGPEITENSVAQASGSATLQVPSETTILTRIYAKLGRPDALTPSLGKIEINVDFSSAGKLGDSTASDFRKKHWFLENTIVDILMNPLFFDLKQLCLKEELYCWTLRIDILVMNFGGNLTELTLNCLSAALKTVRLPKVRVKDAFVDHEMDDQLVNTLTTGTGDFTADLEVSHSEFEALDCSKLPQFLSIFKNGSHYYLDPLKEEEQVADASFLVLIGNINGKTCMQGLVKEFGDTVFNKADLENLLEFI